MLAWRLDEELCGRWSTLTAMDSAGCRRQRRRYGETRSGFLARAPLDAMRNQGRARVTDSIREMLDSVTDDKT